MEKHHIDLTQGEISAIKDARDYLENVADDRDASYITWQRQDEVVKILDKLLNKLHR